MKKSHLIVVGFDEIVTDYRKIFVAEWDEQFSRTDEPIDVAFVFCGYVTGGKKVFPKIVKLESRGRFTYNPITSRGFASSGRTEHGAALYIHHRFYREDPLMPLVQAKLLAYCIASEVAEFDNIVGGPIEMEVITPQGSGPLRDLKRFERARQEILDSTRSLLAKFR